MSVCVCRDYLFYLCTTTLPVVQHHWITCLYPNISKWICLHFFWILQSVQLRLLRKTFCSSFYKYSRPVGHWLSFPPSFSSHHRLRRPLGLACSQSLEALTGSSFSTSLVSKVAAGSIFLVVSSRSSCSHLVYMRAIFCSLDVTV